MSNTKRGVACTERRGEVSGQAREDLIASRSIGFELEIDLTCPSWQDSHLERTWMIASGSNGSMLALLSVLLGSPVHM